MNCDELREVYELYALGVLENPERNEIDEHLGRGCQSCAAGMKRAIETNAILGTLPPSAQPSPRLRQRLMAAIGYEPRGSFAFLGGWAGAWAAAAAVLLIAVAMKTQENSRNVALLAEARQDLSGVGRDAARLREAMTFLNEPETLVLIKGSSVPLPKARVFLNKNRGVMLIASNLPQAPAGKIYEMWVIPKGGAPKPAGLFNSDSSGNAIHILAGAMDADSTAVVAVTLEPEAGSQTPTMPIVIAAGA